MSERVAQRSTRDLHQPVERTVHLLDQKDRTGDRQSRESLCLRHFEKKLPSERIVGHGGGFPGINGQLDIYWIRGYAVAVLSNYDPPAAENVAQKIRSFILGE
jgi:hypothetical protein